MGGPPRGLGGGRVGPPKIREGSRRPPKVREALGRPLGSPGWIKRAPPKVGEGSGGVKNLSKGLVGIKSAPRRSERGREGLGGSHESQGGVGRGREGPQEVQEWLGGPPKVREGSGVPLGGPEVVWEGPKVWERSGVVGKPLRRSMRGS